MSFVNITVQFAPAKRCELYRRLLHDVLSSLGVITVCAGYYSEPAILITRVANPVYGVAAALLAAHPG